MLGPLLRIKRNFDDAEGWAQQIGGMPMTVLEIKLLATVGAYSAPFNEANVGSWILFIDGDDLSGPVSNSTIVSDYTFLAFDPNA